MYSGTDGDLVVAIDHCQGFRAPQLCEVDISIGILVFVVTCNLAKLACFLYILSISSFAPLVIVGDAISSFLESPDPMTAQRTLIDASTIRHDRQVLKDTNKGAPQYHTVNGLAKFHRRSWRWHRASSPLRWTVTLAACGVLLLLSFILLGITSGSIDFTTFGSLDDENLVPWSNGLIPSILLANTPQFLISLVYLLYNSLFTCMAVSAEYTSYVVRKRTLRVSFPRGAQRSTYWLHLRYRYAIPFMITMATLHWLVSESIYLVYVQILVGYPGSQGSEGSSVSRSTVKCGYNGAAILLSCLVGSGLIVVLIIMGGFRRVPAGIPLASTCSRAISAACHRSKSEREDIVLGPLGYGVLSDVGPNGYHRVGFTAGPLVPLEDGKVYD